MCRGRPVVPSLELHNLVDLWFRTASSSKKIPASVGSSAKDFVMVLSYSRKPLSSCPWLLFFIFNLLTHIPAASIYFVFLTISISIISNFVVFSFFFFFQICCFCYSSEFWSSDIVSEMSMKYGCTFAVPIQSFEEDMLSFRVSVSGYQCSNRTMHFWYLLDSFLYY